MKEYSKEVFGREFDLAKELNSVEEDARVILNYFNENNEDWAWSPGDPWPTGGCVLEAFRAASIITSINRIRKAFEIKDDSVN